jgi:hypothetical protein
MEMELVRQPTMGQHRGKSMLRNGRRAMNSVGWLWEKGKSTGKSVGTAWVGGWVHGPCAMGEDGNGDGDGNGEPLPDMKAVWTGRNQQVETTGRERSRKAEKGRLRDWGDRGVCFIQRRPVEAACAARHGITDFAHFARQPEVEARVRGASLRIGGGV